METPSAYLKALAFQLIYPLQVLNTYGRKSAHFITSFLFVIRFRMLSMLCDKLILYLVSTFHKQHDGSLCEKGETTRCYGYQVERFHHSYRIGLC